MATELNHQVTKTQSSERGLRGMRRLIHGIPVTDDRRGTGGFNPEPPMVFSIMDRSGTKVGITYGKRQTRLLAWKGASCT